MKKKRKREKKEGRVTKKKRLAAKPKFFYKDSISQKLAKSNIKLRKRVQTLENQNQRLHNKLSSLKKETADAREMFGRINKMNPTAKELFKNECKNGPVMARGREYSAEIKKLFSHIFTNHATANEQATFIFDHIRLAYEYGINITTVVFDGFSPT